MSRHGSLSEQLGAVMAYRNRPEGDPEPIKTNWTVIPSNDNANPEEIADFGFERHLRITPSVEEIMRNVSTSIEIRAETSDGSVGPIIGIGKLRFSDGSQTEKAFCYGPDGRLVQYDAYMPVGSMLGTRDKPDGQLGGRGISQREIERSNSNLAATFDVEYPIFVKRGARRNGPGYSHPERVAMLKDAYANTKNLPDVKRYNTGLPCGSPTPHESFVGLQKGKKGESGAIAWEDIASSIVSREVWDETLRELSKRDTKTLDAALEARNMAEISPGGSKRGAAKRGKRMLIESNDNLQFAMKKAVS